MPRVRAVAAELWKIAPPAEGNGLIQNLSRSKGPQTGPTKSFWNFTIVLGEDIAAHRLLKSAVAPKSLLPSEQGGGRDLDLSDRGKPHVVISKKIAEDYRDPQGRPKRVGDALRIGSRPFEIIGIYG